MTNTKQPGSIADRVMQQISDGAVSMRPRVYYSLLSGLAVAAVVAAGVTLAYLSSIAYFWWRIVSADGMAYGARTRLSDALANFPWWLVIVAVGLGAMAVVLVRRQGRLYRHRPLTVALSLIAASLLLAALLIALDVGKPYAQQHAPMQQQQGQGTHRQQHLK